MHWSGLDLKVAHREYAWISQTVLPFKRQLTLESHTRLEDGEHELPPVTDRLHAITITIYLLHVEQQSSYGDKDGNMLGYSIPIQYAPQFPWRHRSQSSIHPLVSTRESPLSHSLQRSNSASS